MRAELRRNIAEERGSRTGGISHYELLRAGVRRELHLNLDDFEPWPATNHFIDGLLATLAAKSPAFASGMIYALEDSAIPELTIVALIVNACAAQAGSIYHIVHLDKLEEKLATYDRTAAGLSLHDFFAMHLVDFEVGHRTRLADALAQSLDRPDELSDLEAGYGFVLSEMDLWWESLANAAVSPTVNVK